MEKFSSRQTFCDHFSKVLIEHLSTEFFKPLVLKQSLLQGTKSNAKERVRDFLIPKSLVLHLCKLLHRSEKFQEFVEIFERNLTLIKNESSEWKIPIESWEQRNGSYIIKVGKHPAFDAVLRNILETPNKTCNEVEKESVDLVICHVNDEATVEDIRSLLLLTLIQQDLRCSNIFLSLENKANISEYCEIIKKLNLDIKLLNTDEKFASYCEESLVHHDDQGGMMTADGHSPLNYFRECISSDQNDHFPKLENLRASPGYTTAFASRILCNTKNIMCNTGRCFLGHEYSRPIWSLHICSQRKLISAQQTELYHAWSRDVTKVEVTVEKKSHESTECGHDKYLVHCGVNSSNVSATQYLQLRYDQIKNSFEAKHQVTATGKHWEEIICQMRAALIKLEFFQSAPSNCLKVSTTEELLPNDATFTLYNFSRLSTLLETFQKRVQKGEYPPLPPLQDIDFSLLVEDLEWELLLNYMWTFRDVFKTPVVTLDGSKPQINTQNMVNYLQQLSRSLSAFYSRHHILVENLPHLLPLMFARLYLIKATMKVMEGIFNILAIEPLCQM